MTADANGWYDLAGNRTVLRQPLNWFGPRGNKFCPYCGRRIDDVTAKRSMEHLIGRKFVPVGSFDGGRGFNFIFNSCEECNGQKSVYEGQLSAVSQFSSAAIADDPETAARALHKAQKVIHETTRKPIAESFMRTEIKSEMLRLGFVGPPQPEPSMVNMLACRHIRGIYGELYSVPQRHDEPTSRFVGRFARGACPLAARSHAHGARRGSGDVRRRRQAIT